MYDNRINVLNSEWHGSLTRFFDTYTDISNDNTYDVTYSNLVDQLNNGYHIVHVSTHGYGYNNNAWCMETGLPFNSSHALLLYNNLPSVILTDACNQNAFDWPSDPCLSESFIRNSEGGAIVFWGSSREGFSNPGNSISLSFKYNSDFLENLYCYSDVDNSYKARFGFYTTLVKNNLAPSINISDKMRFLQFSINAIGDPEVPIYTDKPYEFTNVSISYSGSNITVNTGGVQNCTIALTSIDPADEYFAVFENVSTATFNDVLCPYNLVITKHNYIPYRNCQQDVYIQNVVFDSNVHVKGRNIYVGRSVIPSSLEGNVFVNPGNSVIFEAEQNVYIKDGFILGAGSTFEIK